MERRVKKTIRYARANKQLLGIPTPRKGEKVVGRRDGPSAQGADAWNETEGTPEALPAPDPRGMERAGVPGESALGPCCPPDDLQLIQ